MQFVRATKPQIDREYVKTGKVYFIYRDLPLTSIHPGALLAANVANCAAEQGRFWEMHDRLFEGQARREWFAGDAADYQTFLGYASELGLDADAIKGCVDSRRGQPLIEADVRDASGRGFNSTPSFLVNGRVIRGAPPYETWKQLFDSLLRGT
jgi:protein-disulfide isomerase